jgi:hypothetical protein
VSGYLFWHPSNFGNTLPFLKVPPSLYRKGVIAISLAVRLYNTLFYQIANVWVISML